jgi:hypothetical protein
MFRVTGVPLMLRNALGSALCAARKLGEGVLWAVVGPGRGAA